MFHLPSSSQKGFAPVIILVILVVGIVVGLVLVKNPQIFQPKAANISDSNDSEFTFTAVSNPCTLAANGLCTSTISWNSPYKDLEIRVRDVPGSLFSKSSSNTQKADWITEKGVIFEAWSGGKLKKSLFVYGVRPDTNVASCSYTLDSYASDGENKTEDSCPVGYTCDSTFTPECTNPLSGSSTCRYVGRCQKTGTKSKLIWAEPNPCFLGSENTCYSGLALNAANYPKLQVKVSNNGDKKETDFTGIGADPNGNWVLPWITAAGQTFNLYSNGKLIDSVVVKGIPGPTPKVSNKLSSRLTILVDAYLLGTLPSDVSQQSELVGLPGGENIDVMHISRDDKGNIIVEVQAKDTTIQTQDQMIKLGAEILSVSPEYEIISLAISIPKLNELASLPVVKWVNEVITPNPSYGLDRANNQ